MSRGIRFKHSELVHARPDHLEKRVKGYARGDEELRKSLLFYLGRVRDLVRRDDFPYQHVQIRQNGVYVPDKEGPVVSYKLLMI